MKTVMRKDGIHRHHPMLQTDDVNVLCAVFDQAPIQVRTLAKRLTMAQSTVFRCITILEDMGLIIVDTGDDPLRRVISLSPAGRALKILVSNSQ